MIITVDGTSGSGKTTIGQALADALDITFVSSGCVYRAAAWLTLEANVDLATPRFCRTVCEMLKRAEIELTGRKALIVGGQVLEDELRSSAVDALLPILAGHLCVRACVEEVLRSRLLDDFVVDGRDMGTMVYPHADCKFFFVRCLEQVPFLTAQRNSTTAQDVSLGPFSDRDRSDIRRPFAPLRPAADAHILCPFDYTFEALVQMLAGLCSEPTESGSRLLMSPVD